MIAGLLVAGSPASHAETLEPPGGSLAETSIAQPTSACRIIFPSGADELPAGQTADLDVMKEILRSGEQRAELIAYAAGESGSSAGRRLALSRGLGVRAYLIHAGIPGSRIVVKPIGSVADGAPADRVDVIIGAP